MTDYSDFYTDEFMREHRAMLDALQADAELAARRAVVACYGMPPGYVPHCGACGKPQPCACAVPPIVAPFLPPAPVAPPARPVVTRYGVEYCPICNLDVRYCRGHAASDSPSKDGSESGLIKRIAEAQTRL